MRWPSFHPNLATHPKNRNPVPYLISTGLVLVSFSARLALDPWFGQRSPLLPFIAAVVISAGLYGFGPGLLAICLSSIIAIWTFITPARPAALTPEQFTNIVVFIVTGAAMLVFANHLRAARKKAENLELELQQAQSRAAMGTMAATLAHELNQPLTAASNYVSACRQLALSLKGGRRESIIGGLHQAEGQLQRAGAIIRHARSLVSNLPVERGRSSLRRMIGRVIELVRATSVGQGIEFEVEVLRDADDITVNTVQIEQVLLNLARNACEAIRDSKMPGELRFKATRTERGSLIEIRDNGPGIPRERLTDLFSATLGSSRSGMGIGLSICRTIVEAHGGGIWAQNNPEGGASFFVLLPNRRGGRD